MMVSGAGAPQCLHRGAGTDLGQRQPQRLRATETVGQIRLLQPRTQIFGGTLHDLFTPLYPAMPANDVQPAPFAVAG